MNTCIYTSHLIEVCVRDNMKTIADICSLLGSYVDWRKIWAEFACQGYISRSRSFCWGVRLPVIKEVDLYSTFITSHSRRSGMDHTGLPANYTIPASAS